jgi:hypothetical protein
MTSELTHYSSRTLAAGALHQDITSKSSKDHLRDIYKSLGVGERAVVQFFISADDSTSPGTRVHYAATALFERSGPGLNVTATIASYESGLYRTPERLLRDLEPESSIVAEGGGAGAYSEEEVKVKRHALISHSGSEMLSRALKSSEEKPLLDIARAIQNIFAAGVPLPTHEHFHYCTFSVFLSDGRHFYLHRGVRGLGVALGSIGPRGWEGLAHGGVDIDRFRDQVQVAEGKEMPYQLRKGEQREKNVRALTSSTVSASTHSSSPSSHPRIKDVT